jgi:exodeoxyribonuclease VII small subunit
MKKMNYDDASNKLQEIVTKIQQEEIGLEELSAHLKEAMTLIRFCKERLRNVEIEFNELFEDTDHEETGSD